MSECAHAHEVWCPLGLHVEKVWIFILDSRNGLVFDDVCTSECQGTWRTHDAVIDEAREEVACNNRYLCFSTVWAIIFYDHCPQQLFCMPMHYNTQMRY